MSKFLSRLKGKDQQRLDLTPDGAGLSSNNPYQYTQTHPPAYESSTTQQVQQQRDENPPPYHDWQSIEDTALLPPPPPLTNEYSSTSNATYDEAAAAHAWCAHHLVYSPQIPNVHLVEAAQAGQHELDPPPGFQGSIERLSTASSSNNSGTNPAATFRISTSNPRSSSTTRSPFPSRRSQKPPPSSDQIFLSRLPLYFASTSNPLSPHFSQPKQSACTIYFELSNLKFHTPDAALSIGYAGRPYPPNRQPGWHRASLAVHSDDGNRYVNDSWGGKPFTTPITAGETVGLAIVFAPAPAQVVERTAVLQSDREVRSLLPKCVTKVYFTRSGAVAGSWDMDEQRDAERDEGVAGLRGEVDLYAAVGCYGEVEGEVKFFASGEGFTTPAE